MKKDEKKRARLVLSRESIQVLDGVLKLAGANLPASGEDCSLGTGCIQCRLTTT